MRYKVSVPGSIMLLGEHAVLKGSLAISCAADQYLRIELIPNNTDRIEIISDSLGRFSCDRNDLKIVKPFEFVLTTILRYQTRLPSGFTIHIASEFSEKIGLGSSAAITAATLMAIRQWLGERCDLLDMFQMGLDIIRAVQGLGSGADLAASLWGGVIALKPEPFHLEKLKGLPPISLIYAGYKTSTVDVVNGMNKAYQKNPAQLEFLLNAIHDCAKKGYTAIEQQDWITLGKIFSEQQQIMKKIGVSDETLEAIIKIACNDDRIIGAKISGSGLGDCVVTLRTSPPFDLYLPDHLREKGVKLIAVNVAPQGIQYECL